MKNAKANQIAFLIVGFLTVLEFLFVRGTFTWLMAVAATVVTGAWNIARTVSGKRWTDALLYLLATVALCMGYVVMA